jgi:hypothetical protein
MEIYRQKNHVLVTEILLLQVLRGKEADRPRVLEKHHGLASVKEERHIMQTNSATKYCKRRPRKKGRRAKDKMKILRCH